MQRIFLLWLMLIPHLNCQKRWAVWQWAVAKQMFTCNLAFLYEMSWPVYLKQQISCWYQELIWQQRLEALKNCSVITILDVVYPNALKQLAQPPLVLFYRGNIALLASPKLAVVGSRQICQETKELLQAWVPEWCRSNYVLVSGNARGVDALIHELTLEHHGQTIAVLGTGLNFAYPKENAWLQEAIGLNGLVLTEYIPWVGPKKWHFPERNRIIVGLSSDVVISQASVKSGSMVSAQIAVDENREVWVVPPLKSGEAFAGNQVLLDDGANYLSAAQNILNGRK
ncbi:DNA processing protein [Weissella uvarum]|uniref:DNA-processing protein DprA n=1 Tax=Weissella uvarum TaxID=1479233 RepID=UPI0019618D08|nr:DNA-processing protein DprA [Weissella uvarum]MBM7617561.1 DNA processing protein [Weissella uvarum]MCM0595557.1 DNA-processing protein DprA [Weissella uvarum]